MNQSVFLLNPSHNNFVRGIDRKIFGVSRGQLIGLVIVGLICAGLGIGMSVYAITEQTLQDKLAAEGIVKLGIVTGGHISRGRSTSYYLEYTYEVEVNDEFVTFDREESVSSTLYNDSDIGDRISLRYLPDDPGNARLVDAPFNGIIFVAIGGAFILLGLFVFFSQYRLYRRDRKLENEGQVMNGTVTKSWTSGRGNKRQIHIRYEFQSPFGATLKGKQSERRRDIEANDIPEGTRIAVVYQNDQLFRAL